MIRWLPVLSALALLAWPAASPAHDPSQHQTATDPPPEMRLPVIGPAPDFDLTSQDGKRVTLADLRGKVVAVTFIFTMCPDICPMLTSNMAQVQEALGDDFGKSVAFVSITVDPENDTPGVLKEYAEAFGADLGGWAFLTGDPVGAEAGRAGLWRIRREGGCRGRRPHAVDIDRRPARSAPRAIHWVSLRSRGVPG